MREDFTRPDGIPVECRNEVAFNALKGLRDRLNVDFSGLVQELEAGNGFTPTWPIFGADESYSKLFFVPTEDIYSSLLVLAERSPEAARPSPFAFSEAPPLPEPNAIRIEDLDQDVECLTRSPKMSSQNVDELYKMLRKLENPHLEKLISTMDLNESDVVMVPVVGLDHNLVVYKLSADNFLTITLDVWHERQVR